MVQKIRISKRPRKKQKTLLQIVEREILAAQVKPSDFCIKDWRYPGPSEKPILGQAPTRATVIRQA